ncbi:hypothetical protein DY000_02044924 [Brassica cretica]|uniref:Protein kinase domain-containing protein n=1 Tax=Brassica cretica TaxID=69181 RepID=A0ABQ7F915_BRACR|nr:hypothetical protein DY000_02044924 [Brassica cretica]
MEADEISVYRLILSDIGHTWVESVCGDEFVELVSAAVSRLFCSSSNLDQFIFSLDLRRTKGKGAPIVITPSSVAVPRRLDLLISGENRWVTFKISKTGIIHRDVKTTNILLDENSTVKVADFGLSRLFSTDQTHVSTMPQGTPGYVDPEYYQCYRLNEKSDVYSFGVVLTEIISSKEAVDITRHRHDVNLANMAVSKIQNNAVHELVDPSLGFEKDPEVKRMMVSVAELAFRCLQQEREARPSMDEIMEILKGIKGEKCRKLPDVVDIVVSRGDNVGLLRHSDPPPVSPDADMCISSSDTAARSF